MSPLPETTRSAQSGVETMRRKRVACQLKSEGARALAWRSASQKGRKPPPAGAAQPPEGGAVRPSTPSPGRPLVRAIRTDPTGKNSRRRQAEVIVADQHAGVIARNTAPSLEVSWLGGRAVNDADRHHFTTPGRAPHGPRHPVVATTAISDRESTVRCSRRRLKRLRVSASRRCSGSFSVTTNLSLRLFAGCGFQRWALPSRMGITTA